MPTKIKGQTRIAQDDSVGRVFSRGHIEQVIKHGLNLRSLISNVQSRGLVPGENNVSTGRNFPNNSSSRGPQNPTQNEKRNPGRYQDPTKREPPAQFESNSNPGTFRQGQERSPGNTRNNKLQNPQPGSSKQAKSEEERCQDGVCQCDDVIKKMCIRGSIPFCNCEKRAEEPPSILNMQLPEFSSNGRTTIGSKFYRNGERSTRKNETSRRASQMDQDDSSKSQTSQRPQFFARDESSPNLTEMPSTEFPKAGHATKFRGQSFKSIEKLNYEQEGFSDRGQRSTAGSGTDFDEFNHLMGGFNPGYSIAENPNPSPSTTAYTRPSRYPLRARPTDSQYTFHPNSRNQTYSREDSDLTTDPLRRQVTLESINNMKLFSLNNMKSPIDSGCCVFCKIGFYLTIIILIWLLILTLRNWDKGRLCKHCIQHFSDNLHRKVDGVFI